MMTSHSELCDALKVTVRHLEGLSSEVKIGSIVMPELCPDSFEAADHILCIQSFTTPQADFGRNSQECGIDTTTNPLLHFLCHHLNTTDLKGNSRR